ncbi:MAG TPA: cytochrome P450 [Streptosporangiaceae bacterium]|jgi:nocardicin N-oxygenase
MTVDATAEPRPFPFNQADRLDIDPIYQELRASEPMSRIKLPYGEGSAWLATRYEDVRAINADPRLSRSAGRYRDDVPRMTRDDNKRPSIINTDPPDHTRLRRLVAKAFTARRMEALRPRVQEMVRTSIDAMIAQGPPADLVSHLALPLPIGVICELLGVPYEDRDRFREWSDGVLSTTALPPDEIQRCYTDLGTYLAGLVARRREEPTDDLLGTLVAARDEGDKLSEQELVVFGVTLLVAGHETTANQLGNFVYTLLTHPDQLAILERHPDLVPQAVEELLRFIPLGSGGGFPRIATEDIEIAGVTVREGEAVFVSGPSANRDAAAFDDPDTLDVTRTDNPHMAFGHGVHHCLGAQLARLELCEALSAVVTRLPGLRMAAPEDELPWKLGLRVRGLRALPVAWDGIAHD